MNTSERRNQLTETIVTCVYCGMEYPQGTPTHGAAVLTEHIKVCEKHPMRELERELAAEKAGRERAEARIAELNMVLNENAAKCIKCLSVQKAALAKSETFREQAELDSERATAKWLQAEARISTLSTQLSETSTKLQNVEGAKEGAEAQCAAMRVVLEKIKSLVAIDAGKGDGLCYEIYIWACEGGANNVNKLGTALLAELQRYREAALAAGSSAQRGACWGAGDTVRRILPESGQGGVT